MRVIQWVKALSVSLRAKTIPTDYPIMTVGYAGTDFFSPAFFRAPKHSRRDAILPGRRKGRFHDRT